MSQKKVNNPFIGRIDDVVIPATDATEPLFGQAVEIDKVKKTGEGDEDFIVYKELVVSSVVNRQDFIDQFADEVGILNVLKRVVKSGDETLLNQRPVASGFMDLTNMPKDIIEARDKIDASEALYNKLPEEIRNKLSKDDLINSDSLKILNEINVYLDNLKKKNLEKVGVENV